jgi:hypothetical protein
MRPNLWVYFRAPVAGIGMKMIDDAVNAEKVKLNLSKF